ncbi:MAG: helix-hairpin-helix domain-containing protein [Peptococcaceae bacterium]|nr:helix-hairpin-helix domain-containing protein [Peptococcaceae bacterium]
MFQVERKQQVIIIVVAAVILFTAGYRVSRWQGWQGGHYNEPGKADNVVQTGNYGENREIVVHVAGAVEKPGVYRFNREMRVSDALERAVPLDRADVQGLNLAAPLKDGQKIVVPFKEESPGAGVTAPPGGGTVPSQKKVNTAGTKKVNINRAGAAELETLPGVGPTLAQRIINHRESRGLFTSEEDIKSVPGIGEKLYDQMKDYISVD